MSIELDIDDAGRVTTAVVEEQCEQSPHTRRGLRRMKVQFRTGSEEEREQVGAALSGGKVTGRSEYGARLKVTNHSYSYTQGSDVTTFTVTVEEVEDLRCDAIVLGGTLELVPDGYAEDFRHGAVVVTFTATTSGEQTDQFEALLLDHEAPHYFPVVRRGVSDTPMRMRFGRCLYRDNDDGRRNHKVVLVQDLYDDRDDQPFKGFSHPETDRLEDAVVVLQQTVDGLLDLLVRKGVATQDDASGIRDGARQVTRRAHRQFDRTEDDDDFSVD